MMFSRWYRNIHARTKPFRKRIKAMFAFPIVFSMNIAWFLGMRHLKKQRKIIYAITPPPRWKDIGDHAQVIAISQWMKKHFPDVPVIEMDKDRARTYLRALTWLTRPDDVIMLHSGGNLGDRGKWSESIRRLIILNFPANKIVSLPQTIFFSDTENGRSEREKTRQIYGTHPDLTIIARDPVSLKQAEDLFPRARTFAIPDFVLALTVERHEVNRDVPQILLVLRADNESHMSQEDRKRIEDAIPFPCQHYDNVHHAPIAEHERMIVFNTFITRFQDADAVVTDRYHGVIFSVICGKPCVFLRSVDHKLTAGEYWLRDVPFVRRADTIDEVVPLLQRLLAVTKRTAPDWNASYFDKLPGYIGLDRELRHVKPRLPSEDAPNGPALDS